MDLAKRDVAGLAMVELPVGSRSWPCRELRIVRHLTGLVFYPGYVAIRGMEEMKRELERRGRDQLVAKWDRLQRELSGKTPDEIRKRFAMEFDGGEPDPGTVEAIARGEYVAPNITVKR